MLRIHMQQADLTTISGTIMQTLVIKYLTREEQKTITVLVLVLNTIYPILAVPTQKKLPSLFFLLTTFFGS